MAKIILAGLLTAQIIASVHVYRANLQLHQRLERLQQAGYLTVPNPRTAARLTHIGPAFFGGLFFTLSLGAGLSLLTLTVVWIWHHILGRNRLFLAFVFLIWAGLLFALNWRGVLPLETAYFIFVPGAVFLAAMKGLPGRSLNAWPASGLIHVLPVLILALLWSFELHGRLFLDIRDGLLLSNGVGRKISDFYYRYTPYPAEAFKSLAQKTLKTADLSHLGQAPDARRIEARLRFYDYLPVGGHGPVDLSVQSTPQDIIFENAGQCMIQTPPKAFLSGPHRVLAKYSWESDRHRFFRGITFFSFLVGFPIALYALFHALFGLVWSLFSGPKNRAALASFSCFILALGILFLFHQTRGRPIETAELADALQSPRLFTRLSALRIIQKKRLAWETFEALPTLSDSPHVAERYRLVRLLGSSRKKETYRLTLHFLDDPHPNVRCMAYHALGNMGRREAIGEILKKMKGSDHWYVQMYAYKALRRLGWVQKKSK